MDSHNLQHLIDAHVALLTRLQALEEQAAARDLLIGALLQDCSTPDAVVQAFLELIQASVANQTDLKHAKRWISALQLQYRESLGPSH